MNKLEELLEAEVCDKQTVRVLTKGDRFVERVVDWIYEDFANAKETEISPEEKNRQNFHIGSKLIFLEDYLGLNAEQQAFVVKAFEDKKREVLFRRSKIGNIYGDMVIAEAKEEYAEFRQAYNGDNPGQGNWSYPEKATVELTKEYDAIEAIKIKLDEFLDSMVERKRDSLEIHMKKIREALSGVRQEIYKYTFEYEDEIITAEYLRECEPEKASEIPNQDREYPKSIKQLGKSLDELFTFFQSSDELDFANWDIMEEDIVNLLSNDVAGTLPGVYGKSGKREYTYDSTREQMTKFIEHIDKAMTEFEQRADDVIERSRDTARWYVLEGNDFGGTPEMDELVPIEQANSFEILGETHQDFVERTALEAQLSEIKKTKSSSRLKNANSLEYSMELSDKNPLDVRFGNDSGCCIGIYDRGIGNAYGLAHTILDNSTYVFNVYQSINGKKKKRVGIVLAFEAEDEEGNMVLACNSLELSTHMNPLEAISGIVDYVENGLIDFAEQNEFEAVFMGMHNYNTSVNYRKEEATKSNTGNLKKVGIENEPRFYSEIVGEKGEIASMKGFYKIMDKRDA